MERLRRILRGQDGRLRAGWRILIFLLVLVVLSAVATFLLRAVVGRTPGPPPVAIALKGLLAAALATLAVLVSRRFLDRRSLASLGLGRERIAADLLFGFLLSAMAVGAIAGLFSAAGWARVAPAGLSASDLLLLFVGTAASVAWWEELVFRGYVFRNLVEGLGLPVALVTSCILYGVVHALNPSATVSSTLVVALIGFLRIFGLLATRQLWLSIGMHAGWNFLQGAVLGLPVSGRSTEALLTTEFVGPRWMIGGPFGLESGAAGLLYVALAVTGILLWIGSRPSGRPAVGPRPPSRPPPRDPRSG